jgi:hypothetical protein
MKNRVLVVNYSEAVLQTLEIVLRKGRVRSRSDELSRSRSGEGT